MQKLYFYASLLLAYFYLAIPFYELVVNKSTVPIERMKIISGLIAKTIILGALTMLLALLPLLVIAVSCFYSYVFFRLFSIISYCYCLFVPDYILYGTFKFIHNSALGLSMSFVVLTCAFTGLYLEMFMFRAWQTAANVKQFTKSPIQQLLVLLPILMRVMRKCLYIAFLMPFEELICYRIFDESINTITSGMLANGNNMTEAVWSNVISSLILCPVIFALFKLFEKCEELSVKKLMANKIKYAK